MLNTEYLDKTQQQRIQMVTDQLSLIQKQGLKEEAVIDLTNAQASKVRKEIDILWYDAITRRTSAEALKKQADAAVEKITKEYELGKGHLDLEEQKNLREWIYQGIDQITNIVDVVGKMKNGTTTDASGKFELNLPDGRHRIRVTYLGYEQGVYQTDHSEKDVVIKLLISKNLLTESNVL